MPPQPPSAAGLEDRLTGLLAPVLSPQRSAAPLARALARFARARQELVVHWTGVIAATNAELAYAFAANAPAVLDAVDDAGVEAWAVRALDVYDRDGLYPAGAVLADAVNFAARYQAARNGALFEQVRGVLEHFVCGLSGRPLKLAAADEAYTDTEILYLPPQLSRFRARADNRRLYKAMVGHLWAQSWYGTFRADLAAALARYGDPVRALRLFQRLETARLDACIARDLPGLHREMAALQALQEPPPQLPPAWRAPVQRLCAAGAGVDATLAALRELYPLPGPPPAAPCYQGTLRAADVSAVMAARRERERAALGLALRRLQAALDTAEAPGRVPGTRARFGLRRVPDPDWPDGLRPELTVDGTPAALSAEERRLVESIVQDLGDVPDALLVPAGDGGHHESDGSRGEEARAGSDEEHGAWRYHEWDHRRRHYRRNWCVLRELDVHPRDEPFVDRTLQKYAGLAARLRRSFEALRGENRLLKKQKYGGDVDLDALVEAVADARSGREMSERLFARQHRVERDIAVMFMVDMSGSTKGWINDAEREALVLLCDALEVLGDRYAIYGFSGSTRKRCELYRIKRIDEPYGAAVSARIAGIRPRDYTRMGVTIRHLTHLLGQIDARTKLLITLSDGRPDDYDGYRGRYGIEDTRQALIEARREGIHPFCITIDRDARDYLPHMYGPVSYVLVDDVWKLPARVAETYRKLTT